MKLNKLILAAGLSLLMTASLSAEEKTAIRPSAYPLVSIDPYTSAWSMTDNLYDSSVKHWTGKDFPLDGAVKVDGDIYRFMGTGDPELVAIAPISVEEPWTGQFVLEQPKGDWAAVKYNDKSWLEGDALFGSRVNNIRTRWNTRSIWVRRTVNLNEDYTGRTIYLKYTNDDIAEYYINGIEVFVSEQVVEGELIKLPAEVAATLKPGKNVIAATCTSPTGGAALDFGLYVQKSEQNPLSKTAVQKSAMVLPMQTVYTFDCGKVDLKLTFTAPLFMDNLDLLSRPVNYISYEIVAKDGAKHDVSVYFEASPRWALNTPEQASVSEAFVKDGLSYIKSGSVSQEILAHKGDDIRIDWGYFYMAGSQQNSAVAVGGAAELRDAFAKGTFKTKEAKADNAKMGLALNYGSTAKVSDKVYIGYDDIYSIQYFHKNLRAYWNRIGNKTIFDMFNLAAKEYDQIMVKVAAFNDQMIADARKAGGQKYAELCAVAYRQAIHAHKLVEAPNGDLLWLSKENNSNGSIGTVDVTYPSAPLFLIYNPELAKGLLNHIYYYAESDRWTKPFPSHDVGTYPIANGQTYGGDMPVEEAGNVITLTAAICAIQNDPSYAKKHWFKLTQWTDYLMSFGLDPENQLCTDDFAGRSAHNVNLSVKAILGIASYGQMAKMLGYDDIAEKYIGKAKDMAKEWMKMADDGDHYRLNFDKPGTWSQKYNLVWDKLLGLDIFPKEVYDKEIAYYLKVQNKYGLPLDSRKEYTKIDWILWSATLASNIEDFQKIIDPLYKFENETVDRVPMSDWTHTDNPHRQGFKARSVVGGLFIKMLDK